MQVIVMSVADRRGHKAVCATTCPNQTVVLGGRATETGIVPNEPHLDGRDGTVVHFVGPARHVEEWAQSNGLVYHECSTRIEPLD
jgi:hypothetical protein